MSRHLATYESPQLLQKLVWAYLISQTWKGGGGLVDYACTLPINERGPGKMRNWDGWLGSPHAIVKRPNCGSHRRPRPSVSHEGDRAMLGFSDGTQGQ